MKKLSIASLIVLLLATYVDLIREEKNPRWIEVNLNGQDYTKASSAVAHEGAHPHCREECPQRVADIGWADERSPLLSISARAL